MGNIYRSFCPPKLLTKKHHLFFLIYPIFNVKPNQEFAFISTYEKLGFIKNNHLLVLSPQKKVHQFKIMPNHDQIPEQVDPVLKEQAISFYQTASYMYKNKLYQF